MGNPNSIRARRRERGKLMVVRRQLQRSARRLEVLADAIDFQPTPAAPEFDTYLREMKREIYRSFTLPVNHLKS